MPANLKDLRSRIKSVKNTQQITKAMKLVSAAKLGRAQSNVVSARPYSVALSQMAFKVASIVSGGDSHPLLSDSSSKLALVIVLSSERGLCGGYNASITKHANKIFNELEDQGFNVSTICIGKKSFQSFLRKRRLVKKITEDPAYVTESDYVNNPEVLLNGYGLVSITTTFDKPSYSMAKRLSNAISTLYTAGKIGRCVVVYSRFQSAMTQIPIDSVLLPIQTPESSTQSEPIFEPELEELLTYIAPRYMTSVVFQTLLEAVASEHGARMTSMDSATRNAKEMERKLQITYQRARQAAITNELIEIISGAESL